ncbi:MAG TPA: hypothetical protein VHB98_07365 [Chloroflexota bacterium]|nr:hypothetical protein [Chloroflexota bacterium]
MNETRVHLLAGRLRPALAADLPPDAAGSKALALALLAVQAEGEHEDSQAGRDALLDDAHLLPAFVEGERDRGSTLDLASLVRRFVQGERAPAEPVQSIASSGVAQRRARLRALQREGVDLSLIEATLALSPTARIANMERQLVFVQQLQRAKREQEAGR